MRVFYTVDRSRLIKYGDTFHLNTDLQIIPNIRHVTDLYSIDDAVSRTLELFPEGVSRHGIQYMLTTPLVIFQHGTRIPLPVAPVEPIMEAIFEQVRRNEFPDRPSRMQSIFAWVTSEQATIFSKQNADAPIFGIETDNFFIADQSLIHLGASAIGTFELAKRYWRGEHRATPLLEAIIPLPQVIGPLYSYSDHPVHFQNNTSEEL